MIYGPYIALLFEIMNTWYDLFLIQVMRTQCNFGLVPVTLSYVVKPGKNLSTRFGTMLTAGREVPGMCQGTTSSVKPIQLIFYRKLVLNSTSPHHQPASSSLQFRPTGGTRETAWAGAQHGRGWGGAGTRGAKRK